MTETLKEDVTPLEDVTSVSFSQYQLWATCPWAWKIRYVDKVKSPSGINLVFGTAMHNTIQHWLTLYYSGDKLKTRTFDMAEMLKDELMRLVKEELLVDPNNPLTTQAEVAECYADGCNIIEHVRKYVKDFFPTNRTLVGVEVPIEAQLDKGIKLKGFLDIVTYHKATKTLYIDDFKTSRYGWFSEKKDVNKTDQLLLYKKYYSELFGIPVDNIIVRFIILKRKLNEKSDFIQKHTLSFEPSHGKVSMKRANERFQNFLNVAFDDNGKRISEQIPTPSEKACKYCIAKDNVNLCNVSWYKKKKKV